MLRNFLNLQENLEYLQCASTLKRKIKFENVSSVSILRVLKEFKTKKHTGIDNLAGRILEDNLKTLCTPIAKICKLSIKLASFANECKVGKVKPLYKKGLKTDPKSFRPVSLLLLASKSIEQIIHDQTINLLSENNVLYKFQSGFRKFQSTDSYLSYLHDKTTKGFDSGLLTGMVLIDLQKAFDQLTTTF